MTRDEYEKLVEMVGRECIANKLRILNRAVTAIYDEALRPHGVTIGQMTVLVTVSRMRHASPGAVGRLLHMEKSTLSRNVERMRARGWLDARPASDGRTTELHVSPVGRRLLRDAHSAWSRAQHRTREMLGTHGLGGIVRSVARLSQVRPSGV